MDTKMKDGGPAFPSQPKKFLYSEDGKIVGVGHSGMSLRDWFAQNAPLGEIEEIRWKTLSRSAQEELIGRKFPEEPRQPKVLSDVTRYQIEQVHWYADVTAALRFIMSDAMLRAREKGNDHE